MRSFFLYIFIILSLVFASCKTEAPKLKLSRNEKSIIDSLYKYQIPALDSEIDSLCLSNRAIKYQPLKDSIIAVRLSEIEQILPE